MLSGWLESRVSHPARKFTLSCAALALFVCFGQGKVNAAQQDLHGSVSSDGQTIAAGESSSGMSRGFGGTGNESDGGAEVLVLAHDPLDGVAGCIAYQSQNIVRFLGSGHHELLGVHDVHYLEAKTRVRPGGSDQTGVGGGVQ